MTGAILAMTGFPLRLSGNLGNAEVYHDFRFTRNTKKLFHMRKSFVKSTRKTVVFIRVNIEKV